MMQAVNKEDLFYGFVHGDTNNELAAKAEELGVELYGQSFEPFYVIYKTRWGSQ